MLAGLSLALTSPGLARAAETQLPLTVGGLTGPRSLSLAGGVGLVTGTEAVFVNPAGLAARKRYVVDGLYAWDTRPGPSSPESRAQLFGGAISDSVSTPLAAGLSVLRASKGVQTGYDVRLGLAGPITDSIFVGVAGRYDKLKSSDGSVEKADSVLNVDAGVFWQVTRHVSIGGAAYNLVANDKDITNPREFGAGIAIGSETSLQVTADWRMSSDACFDAAGGAPRLCTRDPQGKLDSGLRKKSASRIGGGVEYLIDNLVPIRGGFQVDDVSKTKWWSAGIGLVGTQAALDIGYRQSLDKSSARTVIVAVRAFLPNE